MNQKLDNDVWILIVVYSRNLWRKIKYLNEDLNGLNVKKLNHKSYFPYE